MSTAKKNKETEAAVAVAIAAQAAANVARDVATEAAKTAANVVALAAKTTESVLLLGQDITYMKGDLGEIKKKLETVYVTEDRFKLLQNEILSLIKSVEQLTVKINTIEKYQYEGKGQGDGVKAVWGYVAGGIGLLIAMASFIIPYLKS